MVHLPTNSKQTQTTQITKCNFYTIILVIKTSNKRKQCAFTRIITYESKLLIIRLIDNVFINIDGDTSIKILLWLSKLGKQVRSTNTNADSLHNI